MASFVMIKEAECSKFIEHISQFGLGFNELDVVFFLAQQNWTVIVDWSLWVSAYGQRKQKIRFARNKIIL